MRIESLQRYQRPRGTGRFADLPPDQRALAESHHARLCAKWGDDLPQWRRAILVGRAKDLVLRPRDAAWGRALRKGRQRQPAAPALSPGTPTPPPAQPAIAAPPSVGTGRPAQVASLAAAGHGPSYRTRASMASPRPAHVASSPPRTNLASSGPAPSTLTPPALHAVHVTISGITASGRDGAETAQRIVRDLELRAFGDNLHFSIAVPGKDLPPGWVWRLEVVPVS